MMGLLAALIFLSSNVGDWTVSDMTDNDTGLREVDALTLSSSRPELVFLKMRCLARRPALMIEWYDLPEPKLMVFEVRPTGNPSQTTVVPAEKSTDNIYRGMIISNPSAFVAIADQAKSIQLTAHTSYSPKTVEFATVGTAAAWKRVVEHCKTDV